MPALNARFYFAVDPGPGTHVRYLWFELAGANPASWIGLDDLPTGTAPVGRLLSFTPTGGKFDVSISDVPAGTYYVESRIVDDATAVVSEATSVVVAESGANPYMTTKGRIAAAQLTASGTTAEIDVSASLRQTLYARHSNGSGSVSSPATLAVHVRPSAGTFIAHATLVASSTTAAVDAWAVDLPDDCAGVRVAYVAPVGPTGPTLDVEVGTLVGV